MQKIILIGGGGHARVLIDLIKLSMEYEIMGILDKRLKAGSSVSGIFILGNDNLLPELYLGGIKNACIAFGSIMDNSKRKMLYKKVKQIGFSVPNLIHPKAIISENVQLSEGIQIMAGAIIQANSVIEENTIINTGSIIEHDCHIGKHVHVCPGAVVLSGCTIGDSAFIGARATVKQKVNVGKNSIVAAGAVVIKEVSDNAKVMGIPAK